MRQIFTDEYLTNRQIGKRIMKEVIRELNSMSGDYPVDIRIEIYEDVDHPTVFTDKIKSKRFERFKDWLWIQKERFL